MTGQESGHVMGDIADAENRAVNGTAENVESAPAKSAPQSPVKSKAPTVHRSPSLVSLTCVLSMISI